MNYFISSRINAVLWGAWAIATIGLVMLGLCSGSTSQLLALRTVMLGLGAAAVAMPIGGCLVWISRQSGLIPRVVLLTTIALLFVPVFLQVSAWDAAFGRLGWLTSTRGEVLKPLVSGWPAAMWIHGVAAAPQVAILLLIGLASGRRTFEEQALLDTTPLGVFWHVTVKRIWPLLLLSVLWTMLVCAREIAVTDLYQIGTLAEQIYLGFSLGGLNASPTAGSGWTSQMIAELGTPETGITIALLGWLAVSAALVFVRLTGWNRESGQELGSLGFPKILRGLRAEVSISVSNSSWVRRVVGMGLLLILVFMPLGNLVVRCCYFVRPINGVPTPGYSVSQLLSVLSRACTDYVSEFTWSFLIASGAASLVLLVATLLSWLARKSQAWQFLLIGSLAISCAIPGPMMGSWLGDWFRAFDHSANVSWLYNRTILPPLLASAAFCWPLAALVVWFVFRGIAVDVTEQASIDGASSTVQFFRFGVLDNRAALCGCWLISFAFCWGELAASQLVIPPGIDTIPRLMLGLLHAGVDEMTAALTLVITGIIFLVSMIGGFCLAKRQMCSYNS